MKKYKKIKMTKIVAIHYIKLIFRSLIFISALAVYIHNYVLDLDTFFSGVESNYYFLGIVWIVFAAEMIFRFFPSDVESMGCQKQFRKNYISTEEYNIRKPATAKTTFIVALSWIILNGIIGGLYMSGLIDIGVMLLISLFYSVCDIICILFFCPFQTWLMKNKCCTTCRIYNWDYAMMFTPLLFVKNLYSWSLLALAVALLIKWEIIFHRHPERFFENTNKNLSCAACREKLCHHKRRLLKYRKQARSIKDK